MIIHTFGAYFGLAVARVYYRKNACESIKEGSVYHSDIFAMIGKWENLNRVLLSSLNGVAVVFSSVYHSDIFAKIGT